MYPDTINASLKTLGFTTTSDGGGGAPKSLKELNKRYHLLALRHHPDKVGNVGNVGDGAALFKEINEAHKRVKDYFYSDDADADNGNGNYDSIFKLFIKNILTKITSVSGFYAGAGGNTADAIDTIIQSILSTGIQSAVFSFRKMDKPSCIAIYNILSENQELFSISREIMDELTSILEEKTQDDIVIRLNPSLLDMLLDRVYILTECGQTYYIPLWHSELHFKQPQPLSESVESSSSSSSSSSLPYDTKELIVLCEPELPDNVTIDEHNNMYISLDVNIHNLFRDQIIPVYITDEIKTHGFVYDLHASDVSFQSTTRQCVLLRGSNGHGGSSGSSGSGGIARTTTGGNDMYKVTDRANVYAIVKLIS
jgi:hypothetical protein